MALTVTSIDKTKAGRLRLNIVKVTFDSSYPTGGEALTAAQLGLNKVVHVAPAPASGYVGEYDLTNSKLKAYYGDNNNASDGPLIEVPNTTDLSAVVMYLVVIGY